MDLPNELVLLIADNLNLSSVSSLSQTCRTHFSLLDHHLYKRAAQLRAVYPETDSDGYDWDGPEWLPTPAQCTVIEGRLSAARKLLQYGACFQEPSPKGFTPLHHACEEGDLEMVKFLIHEALPKDGISIFINAETPDGNTPLHLVSASLGPDHLAISELLVQHGANPNSINHSHEPPLFMAANLDMIRTLVRLGADVDYMPTSNESIYNDEKTLLYRAVDSGDRDLVELLLSLGADANLGSVLWETPPLVVAEDIAIAELLMAHGAKADEGDHGDDTTLHGAAERGNWELLKVLLEGPNKVNINIKNRNGFAPLHIAADNEEIVRLLLTHGAEVDISTGTSPLIDDQTPLLLAATVGKTSNLRVLLEAGADIERPLFSQEGNSDLTALQLAAKYGHAEAVKILLDAGAKWHSISHSDGPPKSVLAIVAESDRPFYFPGEYSSIITQLVKKGADVHEPGLLCSAVFHRSVPVVKTLLELGASKDVEVPSDAWEDKTPITIARDLTDRPWEKEQQQKNAMIALLEPFAGRHRRERTAGQENNE